MTKKDLETKVINAQATVAKKKAIIEKHRTQLTKLINKGADPSDIRWKQQDIEEATKKLAEAERIAKNWQDKLGAHISRDAFIEANAPQVIKDFLESWNSTQKPGIVDKDLNEILDPDEVYSGCWGRASINFFPFNTSGNKGIGVGLNNIQKLKDDERLGAARASAESDFGDDEYEDEEDF